MASDRTVYIEPEHIGHVLDVTAQDCCLEVELHNVVYRGEFPGAYRGAEDEHRFTAGPDSTTEIVIKGGCIVTRLDGVNVK